MKYVGKLYGNIGSPEYFDLGKTSEDWDRLKQVEKAAQEMLHRATEGQPEGFAVGPIGVTDYEGAVIWLRNSLSENTEIAHSDK